MSCERLITRGRSGRFFGEICRRFGWLNVFILADVERSQYGGSSKRKLRSLLPNTAVTAVLLPVLTGEMALLWVVGLPTHQLQLEKFLIFFVFLKNIENHFTNERLKLERFLKYQSSCMYACAVNASLFYNFYWWLDGWRLRVARRLFENVSKNVYVKATKKSRLQQTFALPLDEFHKMSSFGACCRDSRGSKVKIMLVIVEECHDCYPIDMDEPWQKNSIFTFWNLDKRKLSRPPFRKETSFWNSKHCSWCVMYTRMCLIQVLGVDRHLLHLALKWKYKT